MTALITSSKCAPGAAIFPVRFGRPNAILVREETRRDGLNSSVGYSVRAPGEFIPAAFVSPERARAATTFRVRFRRPNRILVQEGVRRESLDSWVGYGLCALIGSTTRRELMSAASRFRRPNGARRDVLRGWVEYAVSTGESVR